MVWGPWYAEDPGTGRARPAGGGPGADYVGAGGTFGVDLACW